MLSAKNIAVGYERHTILEDVDFSASKGERIALLGLNGTGKSTLLLSLAALLPLKKGTVSWNEQSIADCSAGDRAKLLAVVTTDRLKTGSMTGFEVAAMGRYPFTGLFGRLKHEDEQIVADAMEQCGLSGLQSHPFAQLSDGQKQRALIARALSQQTPLILLDEPTSYLDVRGKTEVFELISRLNDQLVIFSTHEVERACRVATRCWVIDEQGKFHDLPASGEGIPDKIRHHLGLNENEIW